MMISHSLENIPTLTWPGSIPSLLPDDIDAYCVKCKSTRKMVSAQLVMTKSGKTAARGKCAVCSTTMMKFLPVR